jgi:hypothetical protein
VAQDGGGVPGPGPDEVEGAVGAALEEGIAHELVGLGLMEDGTVLIGDCPAVAVLADGVVDALFPVVFEAREEPWSDGGAAGSRFGVGVRLGLGRGRGYREEEEQEREEDALRHAEIIAVILRREKCASRWPAHFLLSGLLLRGRRLSGLGAGEDGVIAAGAGEQDGKTDGGQHEDDGGVGGEFGEEVGCAPRAEGCLRALAAEGSGEVGRLSLLEEDDADDKERDDNVKGNEKTNQHSACNLLDPDRPENVWIGAEEGYLNPMPCGASTSTLEVSVSPGYRGATSC